MWLTYECGGPRAKAGEGQQAVPCLLHAHYHIMLRVQEGCNQLQAVALQHLDVQGHALGVALHCPHLAAAKHSSLDWRLGLGCGSRLPIPSSQALEIGLRAGVKLGGGYSLPLPLPESKACRG